MGTRSVPRQADERRTAAEKGIHVAGASGRGAGTVPAVTSDATQSATPSRPGRPLHLSVAGAHTSGRCAQCTAGWPMYLSKKASILVYSVTR